MRTITIEFDRLHGFDVVDEYGRRCDGLCFGKLLEQITSLVHPKLGRPAYRMQTEEEWRQEREQRAARAAATREPPAEIGEDDIPF